MINVDISNIWGELALPDLLGLEKDIFAAHEILTEGDSLTGWLELPCRKPTDELLRLTEAAARIRRESDVCVVVGAGGACTGARAAIELLQGPNRNIGKRRGDPMILFTGSSLSSRHWSELLRLLEGKDFSVITVSKSGSTLEPAIAFRSLRWMLERKYGTDAANSRITVVTDPVDGPLRERAEANRWESFSIPPNVGGRFSVLSCAGLLPMAVAGIDVMELLRGAAEGRDAYDLRSYENPVWLYAAVRNLLYRSGKAVELLAGYDPGVLTFGKWWQQLFAESEGKEGKGLFPACAEFTGDLHSLGQLIQQGTPNLFETILRFDAPEQKFTIGTEFSDADNLNYLAGRTLDFVEEKAHGGILEAHADGGVSVITMDCGKLDARKVGELFWFFQLSCAVSALAMGVNPFNRPGVTLYKENMFRLLGKPGFET